MAASAVQNPPAQGESKSAKKKKNKPAERTESPAPAVSATPEQASSIAGGEATQDDAADHPHVRELLKTIRTLGKRLINVNKTDAIVKEHADKTVDDLVTLKLINADQKSQYLKKSDLEGQIADLEGQIVQHKKLQSEFRTRLAEQEKALTEKFEASKAALVAEWEEKTAATSETKLRDCLLVLSQFLRLAAARRAEDVDPTADENLALEGVLLNVYSGDEGAVSAMLKLVTGAEEQTQNTAGETLQTTFDRIKTLAIAHSNALFSEPAAGEPEAAEAKESAQTDPTVAHAGLTEIESGSTEALTNGHAQEKPASAVPANADVADSAANAAGESQWDTGNDLAESQEWVEVKTTDVETPTETPTAAVAAAIPSQSWADDHPDTPTAAETPAAPADPNDGFHQVQRNRGNRDSNWRGRGGGNRGGYRGRGGEGRGRGRGGPRGGQSSRGPRRGGDES